MADKQNINELDIEMSSDEDSGLAEEMSNIKQPEPNEEHKKSARRVIEARKERQRLRDELDYLADLKK